MTRTVANDATPSRMELASEWCVRLAGGALLPNEQAEFEAWLDCDRNQTAFERTVRIWDSIGEIADSPEAINLRAEALEAYRAANEARWSSKVRPRRWGKALAAGFALAVVPGTLWYQALPDVYETGIGEREIAVLEDGTKVSLDADTRFDAKIGDRYREIVLEHGRAKFDVVKDQLRPFSVRVGDKQVVAIGTSFSVEVARGQMHVVLFEGQVAVLQRDKDAGKTQQVRLAGQVQSAETALKPGMELVASVQGDQARVELTSLESSSSWETGQLNFDNEPLGLAVDRVNRYSSRKVVLANNTLQNLRVSGVYNAGDVEAFAVGVNAVLPVRVTREPTQVTIAPR